MQNSDNNRAESTTLCKNRAFCFFTHPEPPGNSRTFDYFCYDLPLRSRFKPAGLMMRASCLYEPKTLTGASRSLLAMTWDAQDRCANAAKGDAAAGRWPHSHPSPESPAWPFPHNPFGRWLATIVLLAPLRPYELLGALNKQIYSLLVGRLPKTLPGRFHPSLL